MKAALMLALLVILPAYADSEARQGADWVRITANPCSDEATIAVITQHGGDPLDFRQAKAEFGGQAFDACWRPMFDTKEVLIVFGDGDVSRVPFAALRPLKQA